MNCSTFQTGKDLCSYSCTIREMWGLALEIDTRVGNFTNKIHIKISIHFKENIATQAMKFD